MITKLLNWMAEKRRLKEQVRRLRRELDTAASEARVLRVQRNVAWPKPAQRIKADDVLAAFDVEMDNALWSALHQELDDVIGDVLDEVTQEPSASLTAERRVHVAGGAEYLRRFQKHLLDLQHAAGVKDPELAEEEK